MSATFDTDELSYLHSQRIGRLATVDGSGVPQNNPVGFFVDETDGSVLIGDMAMGVTRKFRNVQHGSAVSFVVDDVASLDPWVVRGVEVCGAAEALTDVDPPMKGMSRELIRITPEWIGSWGLRSGPLGLHSHR